MSSSTIENEIVLYGHYDSGHVYKVALLLSLADIPYTYEHVDIWSEKSSRQTAFLEHSRNGEVPCLLYSGKSLIQSNVILQKLARQFRCFGGESEDRLLAALDWQFWEANRIGMCLPQLRYARVFAPEEFTPDSLAFISSRFESDITLLEQHLSLAANDGRAFILDNEPSIADISVCGYLFWADEAGVNLPPAVSSWLQRLRELKGWQAPYALLEKNRYAK